MLAPARIVLQQASLTNAALGHENLGPLSEAHGFISARPPIVDLPPPSTPGPRPRPRCPSSATPSGCGGPSTPCRASSRAPSASPTAT